MLMITGKELSSKAWHDTIRHQIHIVFCDKPQESSHCSSKRLEAKWVWFQSGSNSKCSALCRAGSDLDTNSSDFEWVRIQNVMVCARWSLDSESTRVTELDWRTWLGRGTSGLLCLAICLCHMDSDKWWEKDGWMDVCVSRVMPMNAPAPSTLHRISRYQG